MSILKCAQFTRDIVLDSAVSIHNYVWDSLESYFYNKINLITKEDTLWNVGVGPTGLSLLATGPYVSDATGIDPALWYSKELGSSKNIGKYVFLNDKIENVIEEVKNSGISPTVVISSDFSGMHNNISDLIDLGVDKFIITPCGCDSCVEEYHIKDILNSDKLQKMYPQKTYSEVVESLRNEKNQTGMNSAFLDLVDMAEVCNESGYKTMLLKKAERPGKDLNQNYLLIATKGDVDINSLYSEQTKFSKFVFNLFFSPMDNPCADK